MIYAVIVVAALGLCGLIIAAVLAAVWVIAQERRAR